MQFFLHDKGIFFFFSSVFSTELDWVKFSEVFCSILGFDDRPQTSHIHIFPLGDPR